MIQHLTLRLSQSDRLACAVITNDIKKSWWLTTVKIYFLLMLHVYHGLGSSMEVESFLFWDLRPLWQKKESDKGSPCS